MVRHKENRVLIIPCPGTALNILNIHRLQATIRLFPIKWLHDFPALEKTSAFIFNSSMKGLKDSAVKNTALHVVCNHWGMTESHVVPGMGWRVGTRSMDIL